MFDVLCVFLLALAVAVLMAVVLVRVLVLVLVLAVGGVHTDSHLDAALQMTSQKT